MANLDETDRKILALLQKDARLTHAEIAEKIALVLTGGDVPNGSRITEQELLDLEKEGFAELIQNAKTHERISGMVQTRRPVRN